MRLSTLVVRTALVGFVTAVAVPLSTLAQTFAASTGTDAIIKLAPAPSEPQIKVPSHAKDDETMLYGRVRNGIYSVDGMVAKVRLNYDINAVRYLYLFVPGVGTAILSDTAFAGEQAREAHLQGNDLQFMAGDHRFNLTGVALQDGAGRTPTHLFVKLDQSAWKLSQQPMVGFGRSLQAPFEWPGSVAAPVAVDTTPSRVAPAVPVRLLPSSRAVLPKVSAAATRASAPQPVTLP